MRDLPASPDLLTLGRELLLDELVPLLPPERHREARLIATAIAITLREMAAGEGWQQEIMRQLAEFYDEGQPDSLNRFTQDLRNGAFETSPSRAAAARAILWRLTMAKLREGNPYYLAANGFDPVGGESE